MSLLNEFLAANDDLSVERASVIEFSENTVKFGDSLYQLKNITGLTIGEIPKDDFPTGPVVALFLLGLPLMAAFGLGLLLWIWAFVIIIKHNNKTPRYGLSLMLNSGKNRYFVSEDKQFLGKVVSRLYELMEGQQEGRVIVNMEDKSINVYGELHGVASSGDSATVDMN